MGRSTIDFQTIKASVTIQQAMDLLGIKVTRWQNSDQARCRCPCGTGDASDLSINTKTNKFQCFGSKPKASGDIITFVSHAKNIGLRDAAKLLQEHCMSKSTKPAPKPVSSTTVEIANDNTPSTPDFDDALEAFIAQLE